MINPIRAHLQFHSNVSISLFPFSYIYMHPCICVCVREQPLLSTLQISSVGEKIFVLICQHFQMLIVR